MKFKFIWVIIAAIIALCSTSCVENTQASQTPSTSGYKITRVHWDPMYDMKIYKVQIPGGKTQLVLWEETSGGLCVLD